MGIDAAIRMRALHAFKQMKENDLSRKILIPFFTALGYFDVQFHGGPNEEGKDLICWREDEISGYMLTVAQVKRLDYKSRHETRIEFRELIQQLRDAAKIPIPYKDGHTYLPTIIYFITPYEVDTRLLQQVLIEKSEATQIRIIDGALLVEILEKNLPNMLLAAAGNVGGLALNVDTALGSAELMRALNRKTLPDVTYFYSHLNFSVGNITTSLFFDFIQDDDEKTVVITSDWAVFKNAVDRFEKHFRISIVDPSADAVERSYRKQKVVHESLENRKLGARFTVLNGVIADSCHAIAKRCDEVSQSIGNRIENGDANGELLSKLVVVLRRISLDLSVAQDMDEFLLDKLKQLAAEAVDLQQGLESSIDALFTIQDEISHLAVLVKERSAVRIEYVVSPKYIIKINTSAVADQIIKIRDFLTSSSERFSLGVPTKQEVGDFLEAIREDFAHVDLLFSHHVLRDAIGFTSPDNYAYPEKGGNRFTIPLNVVFDSGCNVAVFGEAGAGKTTTLNMYAYELGKRGGGDAIVLLLPLNKIGAFIEHQDGKGEPVSYASQLLKAFCRYYKQTTPSVTDEEFRQVLKSKNRVVMLLDGVDEVIKVAPWILVGVNEICKEYKNIQIILSTRTLEAIAKEIKYLGVSLLPFTKDQLKGFVRGWYKDSSDAANKVLAHIEKSGISDEIRNPLLATILCVLGEHGVPLPSTERELYARRMKLLAGYYDSYKQIDRNRFDVDFLIELARKSAYLMHEGKSREESVEKLAEEIDVLTNRRYKKQTIIDGLNELVDPCNILIPMSASGRVGFGHLRFQEYLVAEELDRNRTIDLVALASSSWWKGALVMYAKMVDDISFLIEAVYEKYGALNVAYDTLHSMADVQPPHTRSHIKQMIRRMIVQDAFEEDFFGEADEQSFDDVLLGSGIVHVEE